jgi:hypothetical protein
MQGTNYKVQKLFRSPTQKLDGENQHKMICKIKAEKKQISLSLSLSLSLWQIFEQEEAQQDRALAGSSMEGSGTQRWWMRDEPRDRPRGFPMHQARSQVQRTILLKP